MINLYKQDGETLYGIKEFILDSEDDLSKLPTSIRSGSSALVIPTGAVYFLSGEKKWVAVGGEVTSGGGSSASNCECEEFLNQLDADGDGIIDSAEEASSIVMFEL